MITHKWSKSQQYYSIEWLQLIGDCTMYRELPRVLTHAELARIGIVDWTLTKLHRAACHVKGNLLFLSVLSSLPLLQQRFYLNLTPLFTWQKRRLIQRVKLELVISCVLLQATGATWNAVFIQAQGWSSNSHGRMPLPPLFASKRPAPHWCRTSLFSATRFSHWKEVLPVFWWSHKLQVADGVVTFNPILVVYLVVFGCGGWAQKSTGDKTMNIHFSLPSVKNASSLPISCRCLVSSWDLAMLKLYPSQGTHHHFLDQPLTTQDWSLDAKLLQKGTTVQDLRMHTHNHSLSCWAGNTLTWYGCACKAVVTLLESRDLLSSLRSPLVSTLRVLSETVFSFLGLMQHRNSEGSGLA